MSATSPKQFVAWLILFTLAMILLMWPGESLARSGAILLFIISALVLRDPKELSQPMSAKAIVGLCLALGLIFATFFATLFVLNGASSDLAASTALEVMTHPVVDTVLWAGVVVLVFLRVRKQYRVAAARESEQI